MKFKSNTILYIVFFLLIVYSIGATFNRIFIQKDYQVTDQVSCDPKIESCFVYECFPEESEDCVVDGDKSVMYYKMISKNAAIINNERTLLEESSCNSQLCCNIGEVNCEYTLCDSNLDKDIICSQ